MLEQTVYSRPYLIKATDTGWEIDRRRSKKVPRCDCGMVAVGWAQFDQFTASEVAALGVLPLCGACLAEFQQLETDAVIEYFSGGTNANSRAAN